MTAARDCGKEPPEGEAGAVESTSRKRKKVRVAVSIRKGNLLFFPTALPAAQDATAPPALRRNPDEEDELEEV
jgi:hypothetical protein